MMPTTDAAGEGDPKPKMFLFTDAYPYGWGEKTFVEPEIELLRHEFDITVVSLAKNDLRKQACLVSTLPEDVSLLNWERHPFLLRALWSVSMLFSGAGRTEVRNIFRRGFSFHMLSDSMKVYGNARSLQLYCRNNGVFQNGSQAIYYCFWFSTQALAVALESCRGEQLPLVARAHGYDLYDERNPNGRIPWQEFKRDNTSLLIFACEAAAQYFERVHGFPSPSCRHIVNRLGVSKSNANPTPEADSKKMVVSCSNVIPLKRVNLIAEALVLLSTQNEKSAAKELPPVGWTHFGDGEQCDEIKEYASSHTLDVDFRGQVVNEVIRKFYMETPVDVVILLSQTEGGCPVCLQEALAAGIPVIGTNVGGIPEMIDGNGILLSANPEVEEVADAIRKVCFAPAEMQREMRIRSRAIWQERFNVSNNKSALLPEIRSAARKRGR